MINKKIKISLLFTLILSTILCCTLFSQITFAETNDPFISVAENDRQNVKDFTDLWIKEMYHNDGTSVDCITKILNFNEEITGYIIDLKLNDKDNGYFEISKIFPDKVINFALTDVSIVDIMFEKSTKQLKSLNKNEFKLYSDGFNYYNKITEDEDSKYYDLYFNNYTKNEITNNKTRITDDSSVIDLLLSSSAIPSGNDVVISNALTYKPRTAYQFKYASEGHNCGPTNIFNLIKLAENRGEGGLNITCTDNQLYDKICESINFDEKSLGVSFDKCISGIKNVAKQFNTKVTADQYVFELWSDYKRDVDKDKIIMLQITASPKSSHFMTVFGYRETSSGNYLRIIDNLNKSLVRYILFDKSTFYWLNGINGASIVFKSL